MIGPREADLLSDIAKLVRKYGPGTFETLASELTSEQFREALASILIETAQVERGRKRTKARRRAGHTAGFLTALDKLQDLEPDKYALLSRFWESLIAGNILPSLGDLRDFASTIGLPSVKATSRAKAIGPLISALSVMPVDSLRERLSRVFIEGTGNDRSLESWSNLILDKDQQG